MYIEQYNIRPSIDDTYQAEAVDGAALNRLFTEEGNRLINIVICTQSLGIVAIVAIVVTIKVCTTNAKSRGHEKTFVKEIEYKSTVSKQTYLISLSINSLVFMLYAIAMDSAAILYRDETFLSDEITEESNHLAFGILYHLPFVALAFDLLALAVYTITLTVVLTHCLAKNTDCKDSTTSFSVCNVMPTLLGPLIGLINHSPFIAIAYINDSYYTSSIFVYYLVIFSVCFAAVNVTIRACLRSDLLPDQAKPNIWSKIMSVMRTITSLCTCVCPKEKKEIGKVAYKYIRFVFPVVVSSFLLLFFLSAVVIVICFLIIIPLNRSLSGAPHQLIGFYQTIIIFLGIFITYRAIFYKKCNSLENIIKNYQKKSNKENESTAAKDWKDLPSKEKIIKFKERVIDLVEHYHVKNINTCSAPTETGPTDDNHKVAATSLQPTGLDRCAGAIPEIYENPLTVLENKSASA